jgi:Family of unknown function (DUF6448)
MLLSRLVSLRSLRRARLRTAMGPAIRAADSALDEGAVEPVLKLLTHAMEENVRARFHEALARKAFDVRNVTAGREYVKAYVEFIHFVERLYEASTTAAHGHFDEPE